MTQPSVHTTVIPNTSATYDEHWAKTSERVFQIWELLFRDVIPGPTISREGVAYTPEEIAANPKRYFKSYLKDMHDELRLMRRELGVDHDEQQMRDAALAAEVTAAIGTTLLAAVPAMAEEIASRVEQLDPDDVLPVMELAIRNVLGGLNDVAPGTP